MSKNKRNIILTDIKYDIDGLNGYENYSDDEKSGLTREEQLDKLPNSFSVHTSWNDLFREYENESENRDDFIYSLNLRLQKCIEESTDWLCIGFSYKYESAKYGYIEETYREVPFKQWKNDKLEICLKF
jgi:hypothetical protein